MSIDYRNIDLRSGFWKEMQKLNSETAINAVWERFDESGRISAFKFDWDGSEEKKPHVYWDSDVFKWMEGACRIMSKENRPELEEKVNMLIDLIEKNRMDDGYFNIYFSVCEPGKRFTDRNMHELYCAGHMMEAAAAHYYATGSDRFIKIAADYADCIEKAFVTEKSAAFETPGHQEIELALIKLYKITGEKRYLDLSEHFLKRRAVNGKDRPIDGSPYHAQDNRPVEEIDSAVGHAVRCLYMLCGMADCAVLTGNDKMFEACRRTYKDIAESKMYITGGVGATRFSEAFSLPYDLPNETAYAETCAAIGLMMFADRMCRYTRNASYADTVERAMYNGMCSGISLSGDAFFYENPLEINLGNHNRISVKDGHVKLAITQRQKVFWCSCCPPNINRLLPAIGEYIYDVDGSTGYINQFADSVLKKGSVEITQTTDYPWDGKVAITAKGLDKLCIRIPSWCKHFNINKSYTMLNGYAVVENDVEDIVLEMEIKPVLISSCSKVTQNACKAALMRGPIVYCAEAADNCENLHSLILTDANGAEESYDELFHGIVIKLNGLKIPESSELYSEASVNYEKTKIGFIPYYGFANRGESNMLVWLNYRGGMPS